MKNKRSLLYFCLIIVSIIYLFPIAWVVISSFKSKAELFAWPPTIMPLEWVFTNYSQAFDKGNFLLYFGNTTFVAVVGTILTVLINTMAGYALAKYKFKGRTAIFVSYLGMLMVPLEVIMIPIFIVVSFMGLYNSLWGLIIPAAATPTGVFIMRQYLLSVPDSLLEAARIDGATEWQIFWRIVFPIAVPAMAVLAIFSFMWRWNDFLWPLIVISDPDKYTAQLAIANFMGEFSVDWNSLLAMSVVSMIPVLIIFFMFQRYFVQGMATSGMKD